MKMTNNRRMVLRALTHVSIGYGCPPHSAIHVAYILKSAFKYHWRGYENLKSVPIKQQIYRTLQELWYAGLIVGTRRKMWVRGILHRWIVHYQLSSDVERNYLLARCEELHAKTKRAKYGVTLFGEEPFDQGLPAPEVTQLMRDVRSMLQRTHPDKVRGMEHQFQRMKEALDWIRSGIPAPK